MEKYERKQASENTKFSKELKQAAAFAYSPSRTVSS